MPRPAAPLAQRILAGPEPARGRLVHDDDLGRVSRVAIATGIAFGLAPALAAIRRAKLDRRPTVDSRLSTRDSRLSTLDSRLNSLVLAVRALRSTAERSLSIAGRLRPCRTSRCRGR